MQPGRELDALVAEKVMGWHEVDAAGPWGYPAGQGRQFTVPHYSTSIADAWRVMEWMWEHGPDDATVGRDYVSWDFREAGAEAFIDGESAPHAICLAALAAVDTDR